MVPAAIGKGLTRIAMAVSGPLPQAFIRGPLDSLKELKEKN